MADNEQDFYAFEGLPGEVLNALAISTTDTNTHDPFFTELGLFDAAGNLLAYNLHDFESTDSSLVDVTLPMPANQTPNADGTYTYYLGIDAYRGVPQNITPSSPGDYNLFMYTFATPKFGVYPASPVPVAGGSTLVGGNGNDTFVGSSGNDYFTFPAGSAGNVSVIAGSGQETLDLSQTSGETYEPNPLPPNVKLILPLKVGTNTVVGGSPNASVLNQPVTFTATVTAKSGTALPTGSVAFDDGGKILDTETLDGTSDQVSFTTSVLAVGTHPITAVYSPTGNFSTSPSNTVEQQVNAYGTASTLAFMPQPSNTTAGNAINGPVGVVVLIEDNYGNVVANDNSQITIAIGSVTPAPGSATPGFINSTTSLYASGGQAAFTNLVLDQAGAYTLAASDATDTLSAVSSQSFKVMPAAASQLVFTTLPSAATATQVINSPSGIQVSIEDKYGNIETGDTNTVSLGIVTGPGTFTAGSMTSTSAASGVATFKNVAITLAGSYKLSATDSADGVSGSANITVNPLDVTSQVMTVRSAFVYSYTTKNYVGTLSITNTSSGTINGGFQVILKGLPASITLAKVTLGSTTLSFSLDSSGEPVTVIPTSVLASLAPNQKVTLSLQMNNPSKVGITFTTQVLADAF